VVVAVEEMDLALMVVLVVAVQVATVHLLNLNHLGVVHLLNQR
jgi:hypothetical protein